jgi:hypothetical protein
MTNQFDFYTIKAFSTRKRGLNKLKAVLGLNRPLEVKREFVQYGRNRYPRNIYFLWIDSTEANGNPNQIAAKLPKGDYQVQIQYHVRD